MPLPAPAIRPVADEWEWQESARCRSMDSSVFFHPDNERGRARRQREQRAKEICQQCPVKAPCAAFALLSAAVGGGLVFSALSNTCAMGSVLDRMPWNRRGRDRPAAEVLREAPAHPLPAARRRALLQRFAAIAALRLAAHEDPAALDAVRTALRVE